MPIISCDNPSLGTPVASLPRAIPDNIAKKQDNAQKKRLREVSNTCLYNHMPPLSPFSPPSLSLTQFGSLHESVPTCDHPPARYFCVNSVSINTGIREKPNRDMAREVARRAESRRWAGEEEHPRRPAISDKRTSLAALL